MKRNYSFVAFFVGILVALTSCAVLGRITLELPQFPGVTRFWIYQSASVDFQPTARQVEHWALQSIGNDIRKKVIIIGGSSVMLGVGQPLNKTTSTQLRNILPKNYVVLNLALRGGGTYGQGLYVATTLKKRGFDVTYIADTFIGYVPPYDNNNPYKQTYWESRYAGQLNPLGDVDKSLSSPIFTNRKFLAFTNQLLYYRELFNYITYEYFPLVQSMILGDNTFKPLKAYPDTEFDTPYEKRYLNKDWEKAQLEMVQGAAAVKYSPKDLEKTVDNLIFGLNRYFAPKYILVSCRYNPRYVNMLSQELQANYKSWQTLQVDLMRKRGLKVDTSCNEFTDRDYSDGTHLAVEGASKLASSLAEEILNG